MKPAPSPFAAHWDLDPEVTFLNHGSFGACPRVVMQLQQELRQRMEREPVLFVHREMEALLDQARGELAQFVGCDSADLAFVPNATTGVNTVLRSLRFAPGDATKARARIKELLAKRIASQPLSLPNAGSVFRNPPGDHAARLIEAAGLKGHAIGGARVSEMHANFIVNPGGLARASDIEALIAHVRATVKARSGVDLETEVRVVGVAGNGGAR